MLIVSYWRNADMSADVTVRPDGLISLPLLNDVQAGGLTPEQLRDKIAKAAMKFLEEAPTLAIVVKTINSRKVYVTGMVAKPGLYQLTGAMTVVQLLATAGGIQEFADSKNITIVRTEDGKQVSYPVQLQGLRQAEEPEAEHRAEAGRHHCRSVSRCTRLAHLPDAQPPVTRRRRAVAVATVAPAHGARAGARPTPSRPRCADRSADSSALRRRARERAVARLHRLGLRRATTTTCTRDQGGGIAVRAVAPERLVRRFRERPDYTRHVRRVGFGADAGART